MAGLPAIPDPAVAVAQAISDHFNEWVDGYLWHYLVNCHNVMVGALPQFWALFDKTQALSGGDFVTEQAITQLEPYLAVAADAGLIVTVIWASYRMMWTVSVRGHWSLRAMLPRLMLAIILINFPLRIIQVFINANNSLGDFVATMTPNVGFWDLVMGGVREPFGGVGIELFVPFVILAAHFLLCLAYVVRYAILIALAITAPVAALLFVLPDTHHYARAWGRLFIPTLFMQPAQQLVLAIGYVIDQTDHYFPIHHAFALAAALLVFKVPGALGSGSHAGRHAATSLHSEMTHLMTEAKRIKWAM